MSNEEGSADLDMDEATNELRRRQQGVAKVRLRMKVKLFDDLHIERKPTDENVVF